MQRIVTHSERKIMEAARRQQAVQSVIPVLADYARAHGARFLLFGSVARRTLKHDSDGDLLLDFPDHTVAAACNFAETACWDRSLSSRMCFPWAPANRLSWTTSPRMCGCWHERCPLV